MYVVAYRGLDRWKATSTMIHATYAEALEDMGRRVRECNSIPGFGYDSANRYRIFDAEHEPGRSIRPCPFSTY